MFDRAGIDISGIQEAIAPTARVLASARRAGIKIVYLKMGYRPDLSDLGVPDAPSRHLEALGVGQTIKGPDGKDGRVLIRDTWGTDIVERSSRSPLISSSTNIDSAASIKLSWTQFSRRRVPSTSFVTGCATSV